MPDFSDDITLIQHVQRGDDLAIRDIHKRYYKALCYFVARITDNYTDAEDIATESFLKLWEKHQDFERLDSIRSFLFTTARNAALNLVRDKGVRERNHQEIAYLHNFGEDAVRNEEVEAEILRMIFEEIESLPTQCGSVFKMLSFGGYSTAEVAEKMNISVQTVRNHKTKAIQLLKAAILKRHPSMDLFLVQSLLVLLVTA